MNSSPVWLSNSGTSNHKKGKGKQVIRNTNGEAMSIMDAEEIAAWFMHHMTSEQRALFIAERPLVYARMYPEVSAQTITDRVTEHIHAANAGGPRHW